MLVGLKFYVSRSISCYTLLHVAGAANKARLQKLQEDWEGFAVRGSDHLTMLNVFASFEESGANASWCDANSLQFKILSRAKEIRGRFRISIIIILSLY